jgi:hypothetical protein
MAQKPQTPAGKDSAHERRKAEGGSEDRAKEKGAAKGNDGAHEPVDRPGFDLGGSTGKTEAGTGLGLGPDAAESGEDRRLPRGGGKPT